jgi:hypothetical protein
MMRWGMMLGKIICTIIDSFVPVEAELFVCGTVAEPVPVHVPSLLDVGMDKAVRRQVVGLQGCNRLGMAQGLKGNLAGYCFLSIAVDPTGLGFGCRGHYSTDGSADYQGRTVGCRFRFGRFRWRMVAEVVVPSISTLCIWQNKVCCIRADVKDHVARMVANDGQGLRGGIVH